MTGIGPLHLFEGYGVELEYMIVTADRLSVLPICDRVLHAVSGAYVSEVELGEVNWSNELALHVLEFKTAGPAGSLHGLAEQFQAHVRRANGLLESFGARLMPGAMHPSMHPDRELRLWPHDFNAVYEAFNRIFDCRGHGWANLQSAHLNLPFEGDGEFGRLHAAIRLVLPLLPALAASSPVCERRATGLLDTRLDVYRNNARVLPQVTGQVIPEPAYTKADYLGHILQPLFEAIAPYDPEGILQHEWLNSRGAIARFERNTIEIRLLDVQECPLADLAILSAVVGVLKALIDEQFAPLAAQQVFATGSLAALLRATTRDGERAEVTDPDYLELWGLKPWESLTAGQLWSHLADRTSARRAGTDELDGALKTILREGPLARRILKRLGPDFEADRLENVYRELCDCLANGRMLTSDG